MQFLIMPVVLIIGLLNIAAAWGGLAYLIGPIVGSIVMFVSLFLRIHFWMPIAAFIGAWITWRWPWYAALFVAIPGLLIAIPALAAGIGIEVANYMTPKRRP